MEQMQEELPEAWEATVQNRFRNPNDYSIAGALYMHYSAAKGHGILAGIRYGYFSTSDPTEIKKAEKLLRSDWRRPQVFCINETLSNAGKDRVKASIMETVARLLPEADGVVVPISWREKYAPRLIPRKRRIKIV